MTAFTETLARIMDPAVAQDEALALCNAAIPNGLFTAMRFHEDAMEVERLFSSMPDVYPVSGRKPKRDTEWGTKVLVQRRPNLGSGPDDIAWAFSDHETILGLGLTEVLNVPVIRADQVIGTINFLRGGAPFTEAEAATGQILAAALALRGTYGA
ncbi:GAF domain-containing protein [Pseudooceanicola sp. 502str34]